MAEQQGKRKGGCPEFIVNAQRYVFLVKAKKKCYKNLIYSDLGLN